MKKKSPCCWELVGFFFIAIVGTLLHFCFEWSGYWKPLALFCPVNESVWEHLKMAFWPAFFFALIEYFAFGKYYKNFIPAKVAGLYTMIITIIILFYAYTSILGKHVLFLDIVIFLIAVALGQWVSCKLITSKADHSDLIGISIIFLLLILLAFSLFTYFPPKLELFMDPTTESYGIPIAL